MITFSIDKNPADYLLEMANKHKVIRKQAGYTQAELAKRSGVSLGSIKRFELSGQISLESLLKLLHILNRLQDLDSVLQPIQDLRQIEKLFGKKTRS